MRFPMMAALLAATAATVACAPVATTDGGASGTTEAGAINMQRSSVAEFTMMAPFPEVEGGFRP